MRATQYGLGIKIELTVLCRTTAVCRTTTQALLEKTMWIERLLQLALFPGELFNWQDSDA